MAPDGGTRHRCNQNQISAITFRDIAVFIDGSVHPDCDADADSRPGCRHGGTHSAQPTASLTCSSLPVNEECRHRMSTVAVGVQEQAEDVPPAPPPLLRNCLNYNDISHY